VVALATLVSVDATLSLRRGGALASVLRRHLPTGIALLPALILFVLFVLRARSADISYHVPLATRLTRTLTLKLLDTNGPLTRVSGHLLAGMVGVMALRAAVVLPRTWRLLSAAQRSRTAGMLVLPFAFLLIALVIPDKSAGGWTHVRRAEIFLLFGMMFAASTGPVSPRVRGLSIGAVSIISLTILARVGYVQIQHTGPLIAEFMQADRLVGRHCTVLPIIFEKYPKRVDGSDLAISYKPFLQLANRMELHDDRAVLYNYIARLPVYPVVFRPGADPQALIFDWEPERLNEDYDVVDIVRFEQRVGVPVDYVLVWGAPAPKRQNVWKDLQEGALRSYVLKYRSPEGRLQLFRRAPGSGPAGSCTEPDGLASAGPEAAERTESWRGTGLD
jgi:hypothetical protein